MTKLSYMALGLQCNTDASEILRRFRRYLRRDLKRCGNAAQWREIGSEVVNPASLDARVDSNQVTV